MHETCSIFPLVGTLDACALTIIRIRNIAFQEPGINGLLLQYCILGSAAKDVKSARSAPADLADEPDMQALCGCLICDTTPCVENSNFSLRNVDSKWRHIV